MFKDVFRDLEMRVFLAHLVAFIVLTVLLAGLNLWISPRYPWWGWVLIGWGAAVATHAFALLLRRTRRRERIFIDRKTRSFAVHLFAYLATVLILFFVNLTVTPKVWWFYWVALGWGAGIVAHGWCAFGKKRPLPGSPQTATAKSAEATPKPKTQRRRTPRKTKSEKS
ncbi:MAG TPA: 2TM domain-containing protein [Methyloceanibacter sp.]|nr:2TM domain-containing protein [Methyloceanibacter sp.]